MEIVQIVYMGWHHQADILSSKNSPVGSDIKSHFLLDAL